MHKERNTSTETRPLHVNKALPPPCLADDVYHSCLSLLELSITKACELNLFSTRLESFCRNGRNSPFGFRASSLASLFVRPAKTHALCAAVFDAPLADRLAFAIFARIDALLLKFPCMPGSFQSAKIYKRIRRATQGSSLPSRQNVAYASCTSLQCASPTPIRTGYGKSSTFTPPLTETSVKPAMSIDAVRPALRVTHMRRWTPRIASGGQDAGLWEQNPVWLHPRAAHGWCTVRVEMRRFVYPYAPRRVCVAELELRLRCLKELFFFLAPDLAPRPPL